MPLLKNVKKKKIAVTQQLYQLTRLTATNVNLKIDYMYTYVSTNAQILLNCFSDKV